MLHFQRAVLAYQYAEPLVALNETTSASSSSAVGEGDGPEPLGYARHSSGGDIDVCQVR
jgi:hypothetical protein